MRNMIYAIIFILIVSFGINILAEEGSTSTTSVTKTVSPDTSETTVTQSTTTTTASDIDANIVSAIYARYAKDAALIGTDILATSKHGIVTLDGSVTTQSQADEAIQVAKSIPNVKDVRSTINVTTGAKIPAPTATPRY